MVLEEGAEKESQVLDEVLLVVLSVLKGLAYVCGQRQHLNAVTTPQIKYSTSVPFTLMGYMYTANFCLIRFISSLINNKCIISSTTCAV